MSEPVDEAAELRAALETVRHNFNIITEIADKARKRARLLSVARAVSLAEIKDLSRALVYACENYFGTTLEGAPPGIRAAVGDLRWIFESSERAPTAPDDSASVIAGLRADNAALSEQLMQLRAERDATRQEVFEAHRVVQATGTLLEDAVAKLRAHVRRWTP